MRVQLRDVKVQAVRLIGAVAFVVASSLCAQAPLPVQTLTPGPAASGQPSSAPAVEAGPIAIVPIDSKNPDRMANVTGALEVTQGKAIIAASGAITSGTATTPVILPHRGVLRVCASTTVKLAADSSVPAGETPGLLMAMNQGAIEMSFANSTASRNADMLMTPDFRILISGPGAVEVKVRLGAHGDTCVDNAGENAPYVLVSSVFEGGAYRVQPGQHVMFEHGSLHDVVDNEKEPCGCPPPLDEAKGNEFPLAQSMGLAPLPKPAPSPATTAAAPAPAAQGQPIAPMVYKSADHEPQPIAVPVPASVPTSSTATAPAAIPPAAPKKKGNFFQGIGRFFRRIFGAE